MSERKGFVASFTALWQVIHATAIIFAVLALIFGFHILEWLTANETLTNDNMMLIAGLLIGSLVGGFAGIASARATPVPEPSVPESIVRDLIAADKMREGTVKRVESAVQQVKESADGNVQ